MAAIQYPAGLPMPSSAEVTSFERRQFTQGDGPRQDRATQREWLATQDLEFRFNLTEAETFQAWWEADLDEGGAWFSAVWPLPLGLVETARRFVGAPKWDLADAGIWVVTASSEVRGGGELPQTPSIATYFLDTFTGSGLLTSHTPDVAPSGFAWAIASEFSPVGLTLNNAGGLVNTGDGSENNSNTFTPMALGTHWRAELTASVANGYADYLPKVEVTLRFGDSSTDIRLSITGQDGEAFGGVIAPTGASFTGLAEGAHLLQVDGDPGGLVLRVDGAFVGSVGGDAGLGAWSFVNVEVSSIGVSPEGSGYTTADAELDRLAIYPNTEPLDLGSVVEMRTAFLTYLEAYAADHDTVAEYDASLLSYSSAGSGTTTVETQAAFNTVDRSARSVEKDIGTSDVLAIEFVLQRLAAGQKVAVGFRCTGAAPASDEYYLAGAVGSVCTYYESDGTAGLVQGYGASPVSADPLVPGDVIGVVVSALTDKAHFYVNGVHIADGDLMNSTLFPFAGVNAA